MVIRRSVPLLAWAALGVLLTSGVTLVAMLASSAEEAQASFPGKNGRIAFHSSRDVQTDIYAMWPDGSDQRNITPDPTMEGSTPSWSADGKKIAFLVNQATVGYRPDIFVSSADGTGPQNLTQTTTGEYSVAFSPDGTKVVFHRNANDVNGDTDVWVMDTDGSSAKQLTSGLETRDSDPTWSPDGSKIAFERQRTGESTDVWVMGADGTNQTNLTKTPNRYDVVPDWSPDGKKIAFSTGRGGGGDVWVMGANGTNQKNLTSTTFAGETEPVWSPNGRKIAFTRYPPQPDLPPEIYVMRASDGLARVNLTNTAASGENDPTWQPLPGP